MLVLFLLSSPREDHHRPLAACIRQVPPDWKRPAGRPSHTWLRAIEADLSPLNFGLATAWRKATILETNGDILWTQQRSSGVRSERRKRRINWNLTKGHMRLLSSYSHYFWRHWATVLKIASFTYFSHMCTQFPFGKWSNGNCANYTVIGQTWWDDLHQQGDTSVRVAIDGGAEFWRAILI